jgi:hypothetical protein
VATVPDPAQPHPIPGNDVRLGYGAPPMPGVAIAAGTPARVVRRSWEHSIPPTKELRYSITFRTPRGG